MRSPRVALGAALTFPLAIYGCSLLVDSDGLSGGDSAGEAARDASADESSPSRPRDAATDAPDGDAARFECGDGGISPFCDDFERDSVLGRWSALRISPGSTLAIAAEPDGNRFLRIDAVTPDGGGNGIAEMGFPSPSSAKGIAVAFDCRFRSLPTLDSSFHLAVTHPVGITVGHFYVNFTASGGRYLVHDAIGNADAGAAFGQEVMNDGPRSGEWQRWELAVQFEPTPRTIELRIAGKVAASATIQDVFTTEPVAVYVGTSFAKDLHVDIDNLRFDVR